MAGATGTGLGRLVPSIGMIEKYSETGGSGVYRSIADDFGHVVEGSLTW